MTSGLAEDLLSSSLGGGKLRSHLIQLPQELLLLRVREGHPMDGLHLIDAGILGLLPADIVFRAQGDHPAAGLDSLLPEGGSSIRLPQEGRDGLQQGKHLQAGGAEGSLQHVQI